MTLPLPGVARAQKMQFKEFLIERPKFWVSSIPALIGSDFINQLEFNMIPTGHSPKCVQQDQFTHYFRVKVHLKGSHIFRTAAGRKINILIIFED